MATEKSIVISAEVKRGEIINNFAAIKAQVAAKVAPYMGLVFGDEDIRDAKSTVAELRKMRTAIEDKRKAIKKQWNEPYAAFEDEVKQITAIIDEPIEEIDTQIKSFEEVFYSLQDSDMAGWLRSLQLREISLPLELRDEALMIVSERRQHIQ